MRHVFFGCAACLAFLAPAAAHHGPGTFDLRSSVSYPVATLTGVDMINPHSWLYFEVTGADGKTLNPNKARFIVALTKTL
jgi:hypothetical protein